VADFTRLKVSVLDPLDRAGIDLPDEARRLLDLWEAATDLAATTPADTLRAEIADGTATVDNIGDRLRATALALNTQQGAAALVRQLGPFLASRIEQTVRADADRIVTDLRQPFDRALAEMAAAAEHLTPTDTPATILTKGPDASAAHATATDAQARLDTIAQARLGLADTQPPAAAFLAHAPTNGTIRHAAGLWRDTQGPGGRWLALHHAGIDLRIGTPAETTQLLTDAQAATDRERAATRRTPPRPAQFAPVR
jgi:hypothetical protein